MNIITEFSEVKECLLYHISFQLFLSGSTRCRVFILFYFQISWIFTIKLQFVDVHPCIVRTLARDWHFKLHWVPLTTNSVTTSARLEGASNCDKISLHETARCKRDRV